MAKAVCSKTDEVVMKSQGPLDNLQIKNVLYLCMGSLVVGGI